jgi:hypothetical protein
MVKYVVSCFSPPIQLEIDNGDTVEVWVKKKTGNKVVADCIINITKKGSKCFCGVPPRALLAGEVTLKGEISNVQFFPGMGVQFDLETP